MKVISTFAGCGGSSLGWKRAGHDVIAAVEWWPVACETYRRNHPGTNLIEGDIHEVTGADFGLVPGELDVLDGSPPCQGFSLSGSRRVGDVRNRLFEEYVRLLDELQPRAFVMENVAGLVRGRMRLVFAEIIERLRLSGYRVRCELLDAQFFGVPQRRPRLIFVGMRDDLSIEPTLPKPRTRPMSVRQALSNCPVDEEERAALLACGKHYGSFRLWPNLKYGQTVSQITANGHGFNGQRIHPDRPCPTFCKNNGNIGLHGLMHWSERRRLTLNETRRIFGFPDDFWFASWQRGIEQMGNSVPPPLMEAIAREVASTLEGVGTVEAA